MTTENEPAGGATSDAVSDVERATSGLLYMLVRIATGRGCRHMLSAVEHHLALLATHHDCSDHVRRVAAVLGGEWRDALAQAERCSAAETGAARWRH